MVVFLLVFFLLLDISVFYLFNKDVIAPPFIFCAMYTVSVAFALTEYKDLQLSNYSFESFLIYIGGAIVFCLIGYLISKLCDFIYKPIDVTNTLKEIKINKYLLWLFVLVDLIALVLLMRDVKSIGGSGDLVQTLENFRQLSGYSVDNQLPGYDNQLLKVVTVTAYISSFLFINNRMAGCSKKEYIFLGIPVIIYVIYSMFLSNRLNLLELAAAFIIYYCLLRQVKMKKKSVSVRLLIWLILIFVIILLMFSLFRIYFGRTDDSNTQSYLAVYIGGPVKLFDMFIKNPVHSDFWGKETFYGLLRNLRSFGLSSVTDYIAHKEFRFVNGVGIGNVYSAYRPYMADFGMKGLIVLQIIFSIFFNGMYFIMQKKNFYKKPLVIILYGYMINPVFMHPIDDEFYRMFFNVGFILYIIFFVFIYFMLTKKIKIK